MNWVGWALASAFFAGITAILAKLGVASVNPNLATAIRTSVVLVFSWSLALLTVPRGELARVDARGWLFLVLSGLATGLSWICYFQALQAGPVSRVAPIDKLSVAIAILLACVFLGERLTVRDALGAGLVISGALVLAWK